MQERVSENYSEFSKNNLENITPVNTVTLFHNDKCFKNLKSFDVKNQNKVVFLVKKNVDNNHKKTLIKNMKTNNSNHEKNMKSLTPSLQNSPNEIFSTVVSPLSIQAINPFHTPESCFIQLKNVEQPKRLQQDIFSDERVNYCIPHISKKIFQSTEPSVQHSNKNETLIQFLKTNNTLKTNRSVSPVIFTSFSTLPNRFSSVNNKIGTQQNMKDNITSTMIFNQPDDIKFTEINKNIPNVFQQEPSYLASLSPCSPNNTYHNTSVLGIENPQKLNATHPLKFNIMQTVFSDKILFENNWQVSSGTTQHLPYLTSFKQICNKKPDLIVNSDKKKHEPQAKKKYTQV